MEVVHQKQKGVAIFGEDDGKGLGREALAQASGTGFWSNVWSQADVVKSDLFGLVEEHPLPTAAGGVVGGLIGATIGAISGGTTDALGGSLLVTAIDVVAPMVVGVIDGSLIGLGVYEGAKAIINDIDG